jgi:hypothetical protein
MRQLMWPTLLFLLCLKAVFQSSHEAPRSSLRVHAWALSANHNAKQLILIRCKHSQRAARSFVRGQEIRLKARRDHFTGQGLRGRVLPLNGHITYPKIKINQE